MGYYFDAIQRATGRTPVKPEAVADEMADAVAAKCAPSTILPAPAPALKETTAVKRTREKRKFEFNPSDNNIIVTAKSTLDKSDIPAIEQFRNLRVRLIEIGRTRPLRTIVIASASHGDGKTAISTNLAFASSQVKDKRTLLVDGDLRKPSIASLLGMPEGPSLTDYLADRASYEELPWEINPNLDVITATETPQASELLQSHKLTEFLRKCWESYDYVFIDSPPLGPVADAQTLAASADGVLLVVRAGGNRELVARATERIKSKILGVVLNCARTSSKAAYYYGSARLDEGAVGRKQK